VGATLAAVVIAGPTDDEDPVVEQVAPEKDNLDPVSIAEQVMDATVHLHVTAPEGTRDGSGLVFRDDGHILTTADLVQGATRVEATLADGTAMDATMVGSDAVTDLAVLRVTGERLATAVLGSAADVQVGERIIAVGSAPTAAAPMVVTTGVIRHRSVRLEAPAGTLYELLAASEAAELPPGAALVDQRGAVVGVVSTRLGTASPQGDTAEAYAVPIETARRIATDLIPDGIVRHAWLGAEIPDEERPATIAAVAAGSPAAVAGLRPGDVLTAVDGTVTRSGEEVARAVASHQPDEMAVVSYERDGAAAQVDVQLGTRP
jgi:S1-C subfamily serine protease